MADLTGRAPPEAADSSGGAPIINLRGQKVALGPLRRDLVTTYLRWVNDFEVTRHLALTMRPLTLESEEAWYQRISQSEADLPFTIYELQQLRAIGNAGLHRIDHQHRTAEFGMVIGEKEFWGKGFGTETTRLLLQYAFRNLGLHNVLLQVYAKNEAAVRAYTRAGFRLIGRRREARREGGSPQDVLLMDCLSTDEPK